MSNEKFQNKYRIKSARATWHDYNGGAYFITVCAKNHEHFFGEIENNDMNLSEIGKNATENLQNINNHYPYAEIPLFVVMPNHWHAIVFIDENKNPYLRGNTIVETGRAPSLPANISPIHETGHAPSLQALTNQKMQKIDLCKGWLSVAIGGIKSAVTKFANENHIDFAWQTRFYDHIIRDQDEMNRIVDYIENNIPSWDKDCFNKKNKKNNDKL